MALAVTRATRAQQDRVIGVITLAFIGFCFLAWYRDRH